MAQASKRFGWSQIVFGLLAIAGIIDATILTIEHYTRDGLSCGFTGGCERVLTSQYSELPILGIPTALLGVVFYAVVLFLVMFSVINREPIRRLPMLAWSTIGFVSSLGLTSIQAFIIKAWCQYCLLSALTSTLIFIFAIVYWFTTRSTIKKESDNED
ncbi:MAG: hypothetical protein QG658_244 [Patescibacteria group bacterium]|nr:hypothetical protein [Patescibacteria group bacterium]